MIAIETLTATTPRSLGDLFDRELGLMLKCPHCHRGRHMFRDALIARHGRELTFDTLARAAVCTHCGQRGATVHIGGPRHWRRAA